MQIELAVMELLASKICHDLISPVSAINNGVELIEDIGGDVVEEAMKLIGNSADLAARRLKLFRFAYGKAGAEAQITVKEVRQIAVSYFKEGKINLDWPETLALDHFASRRGAMKTLMNALMLCEETLAFGGAIHVQEFVVDDVHGCRIEVRGRDAQLAESLRLALLGWVGAEDLSARTIQAYLVGRFASHYAIKIEQSSTVADHLLLTLQVMPA